MLQIDKTASPVWAMEHEEDGEACVGLRFDEGDSGYIKLTKKQVQETIAALEPWRDAADYGTASPEEIKAGFDVAMNLAGAIKAIPNPAVQDMVKKLIVLIRVVRRTT